MYEQEKITQYHDGEKASQVEQMFDNIAPTYDKLNHRLSLNIDRYWRSRAIKALRATLSNREGLGVSHSILDIATGTGDFAILMAQQLHPEHITATDISEGMMQVGHRKVRALGLQYIISFERADCTALHYDTSSFDAVTATFGVRNFQNLEQGLREMHRVLRPGGSLCLLELSTPVRTPFKQLFTLYSRLILPLYGRLVSRDPQAYSYLNRSIAAFPQGETMLSILSKVGFRHSEFRRLTFGICTLYTAKK